MLKQAMMLLVGLFFVVTVWAANSSILVIDALNKLELPANFRITTDAGLLEGVVNINGLANLFAIGSAQFSAASLATVINKVRAPLIVVDLRQESHGFINGNAISWYGLRDWANLGKTPLQVEDDQLQRLDAVDEKEKVIINKITDKAHDGKVTRISPMVFDVDNVLSEQELTTLHQVRYTRIYVTDHLAPNNAEIDRFVELVRNLSPHTWVYFHCRAGKGRTTTFMVLYDMMRNAKQVSFEDILQRQHLLGGSDLINLIDKSSYKNSLKLQRLDLLRRFYQYSKTNQDNFSTSWSAWDKTHGFLSKSDELDTSDDE